MNHVRRDCEGSNCDSCQKRNQHRQINLAKSEPHAHGGHPCKGIPSSLIKVENPRHLIYYHLMMECNADMYCKDCNMFDTAYNVSFFFSLFS